MGIDKSTGAKMTALQDGGAVVSHIRDGRARYMSAEMRRRKSPETKRMAVRSVSGL
jgi:hypothetical protein